MKVAKLKAEEMKFQLFLKENDNKRQRAVKRAADESKERAKKEEERLEREQELKETEAKLITSRTNLEEDLVYQTYLEKVVAAAPEDFTEIADIIKRHQTLSATNGDLQGLVQNNIEKTEQKRLKLHRLSKQLQNEALVKSSEIAELQERLEKAKLQTAIEEGNKAHRQDSVKDAIRELGEAQMAAFNLYNRCRATHMADSRPKHETNKVMVALAYIEERFRDLQLIVKEGHDAGVIGKVKVREAVVDRITAAPKTAGGAAASGAVKSLKATSTSKGMAGTAMNASQSGISSVAGHPPIH